MKTNLFVVAALFAQSSALALRRRPEEVADIQLTSALGTTLKTQNKVENQAVMASQLESAATSGMGAELASKSGTNQKAETEAKWGFLKNIVNIDSFFSSGAPHSGGLHQKSASFHAGHNLHEKKAPKTAAKAQTKIEKPQPQPEKQDEATQDSAAPDSQQEKDDGIKVEDKSKISLSEVVAKTLQAAQKQKGADKKVTSKKASKATKAAAKKKETKKKAPKDDVAKEEAEEGKAEKSLEDEMTEDIMGEDSTKKQSAAQKPEPKQEEPAESKEDEEIEQQAAALAVSEMEKQSTDQDAEAQEKVDEAEAEEPSEDMPKKAASAAQKPEEKKEEEKEEDVKFEQPQEFVIVQIADRDSKPDEVKTTTNKFKSLAEANAAFKKAPGDKVMILKGKLLKTSIDVDSAQDPAEELSFYRLIGEAYNNRKLERAMVSGEVPGTSHYTYIVDGQPQVLEHSTDNDKKYGYSKQVFNGSTQQLATGKAMSNPAPKLFSTTCSKLKHNSGEKRLNECRLASGFFIVHEQQLFSKPFAEEIKDYGVPIAK